MSDEDNDDDEAHSGQPVRRTTAQFGVLSFEDELEELIRSRGNVYYIDLTDQQIRWIAQHAGVIHRKRGGR